MTIQPLKDAQITAANGGKINSLIQLKKLNLPVPDGIILTNIKADTDLKIALSQHLRPGTTYIVRSSGQKEDGVTASFAGQYTSVRNCRSLEAVWQGIQECLASQHTAQVKSYGQGLGLTENQPVISILVQEQIEAELSGIAFSVNPLNNHDQEILIETVLGAGDVLADGLAEPQRQVIAWHSQQADPNLEVLRQSLLTAAADFGYPLDMEFCFSKGQLFIVQARPITRLSAKVDAGSWTTANFRDGGVAAQACPNLMWSLYREAWQRSLQAFILENGLLPDDKINRLSLMKYARPYWNVGLVKAAMSRIPGFTESEFDDELGITKAYQGKGYQSKLTPKTLLQLGRVAQKLSVTTRDHQTNSATIKAQLLTRYEGYQTRLADLTSAKASQQDVEQLWREIVCEGQLASESVYFKQVFINTVQLSMKKTMILKHISVEAFFQLISKLGEVSHLRPSTQLQVISDTIKQDASLLEAWQNKSTATLTKEVSQALLDKQSQRADLRLLIEWFQAYGYHSERELNLLWPSFIEAPASIIEKIKGLLNDQQPISKALDQRLSTSEMDRILRAEAISPRRAQKIKGSILSLRELLWWREEFKDISTRYYHLVRQVSLLLGESYQANAHLEAVEDVFYLEKENLLLWIDQQISKEQLQKLAHDNQRYCQAFRNYQAVGDLQAGANSQMKPNTSEELHGIGANDGLVTGRVRVLRDVSQIADLQRDEILVTTFTDTGWSHRFGSMKGLITETGGVLSHATIVAREFGLPAIIGAKGATDKLHTGMLIQMNGATGTIQILETLKEESRCAR